jgi:hypothetical protein
MGVLATGIMIGVLAYGCYRSGKLMDGWKNKSHQKQIQEIRYNAKHSQD